MRISYSALFILGLFCTVSAIPIAEKRIVSDAFFSTSTGGSTRAIVETKTEVQKATSNAAPYVDGRLFNIDGITQYFAGTNAWWLSYLLSDNDVECAVKQIAASDLKVARIWAFGNVNTAEDQGTAVYFQVLNETLSPGNGSLINFSPVNGIPRLDVAIQMAEKYNLKLVLPLLNNWDYPGGIGTYAAAFGGNSTSFYTNDKAQAAYKNWIRFIVNRYKSSPAIFSWELCNEPRCSGCDTSVIYNWASDISAYIKSLDPVHMVSLGDEGWLAPPYGDGSYAYSGAEGIDFALNLQIPTLDYATFHLYPNQWGYSFSWGSKWIEQHNALAEAASKPIVLEEYGSPYANYTAVIKPWQDTIVEDTSVAADLLWQFGTGLPSGVHLTDDYAVEYDTDLESDYEVLQIQHAHDMLDKVPVVDNVSGKRSG